MMLDTIHGWVAYVLMDNSPTAFLFLGLLLLISLLLWRGQTRDDTFDLRDVVCSWNDGRQIVSTDKMLLTGAFLASSYYIIHNTSDTAFAAYLAAWVLNGGIKAWKDTQMKNRSEVQQ